MLVTRWHLRGGAVIVLMVVVALVGVPAGPLGSNGDGEAAEPEVRIENVAPRVRANTGTPVLDGTDDGSVECISYGPPPGGLSVWADVTVVGTGDESKRYEVEMSLDSTDVSYSTTVTVRDRRQVRLSTLTSDAGPIEPGDSVTLRVTVRHNSSTVTTVTRDVRVVESGGTTECEERTTAGDVRAVRTAAVP